MSHDPILHLFQIYNIVGPTVFFADSLDELPDLLADWDRLYSDPTSSYTLRMNTWLNGEHRQFILESVR